MCDLLFKLRKSKCSTHYVLTSVSRKKPPNLLGNISLLFTTLLQFHSEAKILELHCITLKSIERARFSMTLARDKAVGVKVTAITDDPSGLTRPLNKHTEVFIRSQCRGHGVKGGDNTLSMTLIVYEYQEQN